MPLRPVKPTKLKELEGNRGRRKPKKEPEPPAIIPPIPDDLDPDARKTWAELAPRLHPLGLLTEADGDAFSILCQIRARLKQIHKVMHQEQGPVLIQARVTIDGSGQEHTELKPSPYTVMERLYYALFRQYAAEFGLTPRGRAGLSVGTGGDDESGFAGLLGDE